MKSSSILKQAVLFEKLAQAQVTLQPQYVSAVPMADIEDYTSRALVSLANVDPKVGFDVAVSALANDSYKVVATVYSNSFDLASVQAQGPRLMQALKSRWPDVEFEILMQLKPNAT